jgi:hypothetical protein
MRCARVSLSHRTRRTRRDRAASSVTLHARCSSSRTRRCVCTIMCVCMCTHLTNPALLPHTQSRGAKAAADALAELPPSSPAPASMPAHSAGGGASGTAMLGFMTYYGCARVCVRALLNVHTSRTHAPQICRRA